MCSTSSCRPSLLSSKACSSKKWDGITDSNRAGLYFSLIFYMFFLPPAKNTKQLIRRRLTADKRKNKNETAVEVGLDRGERSVREGREAATVASE